MTITLDLPEDLERAIRTRTGVSAGGLPDALLTLLRSSVGGPGGNGPHVPPATPMPLQPTPYPDDEPLGLLADGAGYAAVPFPVVGRVEARYTLGEPLTPTALPDDE
jgi:hypothetical protein